MYSAFNIQQIPFATLIQYMYYAYYELYALDKAFHMKL